MHTLDLMCGKASSSTLAQLHHGLITKAYIIIQAYMITKAYMMRVMCARLAVPRGLHDHHWHMAGSKRSLN